MTMGHIELAATRFYFTLFLAPGVVTVYLPVWLDKHGFSQADIGTLSSTALLFFMLLSTFTGRWADRLKDWKTAVVIGSWLSALLSLLLFVSDHNGWIFWIWIAATLPVSLLTPIADAATLRKASKTGFRFGRVRGWGTIGYVLMCFLAGAVLDHWGAIAFLPLFVLASLVRAISSMTLPPLREHPAQKSLRKPGLLVSSDLLASLPLWVILPLLAAALVLAMHATLGAFAALVWKEQGFSSTLIGLLIAAGAAAEVVLMFYFNHIEARFSARAIILLAGGAAILRWIAMAFNPPLWLLFPLQMTHALTFAACYMGVMYFINNRIDEAFTAEAQSLFVLVQQMITMLTLLLFGHLLGAVGSLAFLMCAALSLLAVGMVSWSLLRQMPQT